MSEEKLKLFVDLSNQNIALNEIDQISRQLTMDLNYMGVDNVSMVKRETVLDGAKSVDPVVVGALVATLGSSVLAKILEFLHAWVMRRERQTLKIKIQKENNEFIEIEIPTGHSPMDVKAWIATINDELGRESIKDN